MRKVCIDRTLPTDRLRGLRISPTRLIAPLRKQWINGSTLRVRFIGGTDAERAIVKKEAMWWETCANIRFDFNNDPNAEIRIAFNKEDGAWSYVGTDCANIPLNEPTMNLGFLDPGTAAHEFGHALGCSHEHQNPQGGIHWNEEVVYNDLAGPPNYWDRQTTFHNVLRKYSFDQIKGTVFDPASIMQYFFPAEWTTNGIASGQNNTLSAMDKQFIGSAAMYPKVVTPPIQIAKRITPNHFYRTKGTIGKPGEEDLYVFKASGEGSYTIDTRGRTNMAMRLYGPGSPTLLIAEDDDSGVAGNARIMANLIPGDYYVQIRHSDLSGTGKYTIKVFR